jgi:hypothetical protein
VKDKVVPRIGTAAAALHRKTLAWWPTDNDVDLLPRPQFRGGRRFQIDTKAMSAEVPLVRGYSRSAVIIRGDKSKPGILEA